MPKKSKNKAQTRAKNTEPRVFPLGNRVLVRPFTKGELESKKNNFGIILPDEEKKNKTEQGVVLAVGPGEWKDGKFFSVSVNIGDKVAFSKYGYEDIKIGDEEFYLIKEENILAVLR